MAKKFKTPELEFKFWSEKGLTPSQVMKRMSSKNLAVVAEADRRQPAGDFQDNTFQVDSLKDPTRATDIDVTTRASGFPGPPDRTANVPLSTTFQRMALTNETTGTRDLTTRTTFFPGPPDRTARPRQAVAERGDTYQRLAEKLGVHELDLIRENNGAELTPGTAVNIPVQFVDFRQAKAEAQAAGTDNIRVQDVDSRKVDETPFDAGFGDLRETGKKIINFFSAEGIASRPGAEDIIWKTKDGQPVDAPVEGLDYVIRTTPIKDMPAGQGSGRLAWAESRLPTGTKLDDYNPQDLLEAGIFKEAEIWWLISQGLLELDEGVDATTGGTGSVFMGAGGVKKVAKQITAGSNFGFRSGARPQTVRQMADLGLTSWSI